MKLGRFDRKDLQIMTDRDGAVARSVVSEAAVSHDLNVSAPTCVEHRIDGILKEPTSRLIPDHSCNKPHTQVSGRPVRVRLVSQNPPRGLRQLPQAAPRRGSTGRCRVLARRLRRFNV